MVTRRGFVKSLSALTATTVLVGAKGAFAVTNTTSTWFRGCALGSGLAVTHEGGERGKASAYAGL